jgi:hypothetical protein
MAAFSFPHLTRCEPRLTVLVSSEVTTGSQHMGIKTTAWDSAEYLKTETDIAAYLNACFEEAGDDPVFLTHALGVAARAVKLFNVDSPKPDLATYVEFGFVR